MRVSDIEIRYAKLGRPLTRVGHRPNRRGQYRVRRNGIIEMKAGSPKHPVPVIFSWTYSPDTK